MKKSEILIKEIIKQVDADPHFIRGLNSDIVAFAKEYYKEQLILHDVSNDVVADIRNKLGNVTSLIGLVDILTDDNKEDFKKDYAMRNLKTQLDKAKERINYIKKQS